MSSPRVQVNNYAPRLLTTLLAAGVAASLPAHAAPQTRVLFNIGMRGEVAGTDINSSLQIDGTGKVTGMRARLAGSHVQGEVGNVSESWDDLSFASRNFSGVKLGVPTGNVTTTLLGGSVAIQDRRGNSTISPLYGLRAAWKLNPKLSLNASQLLTPAASDAEGKAISALSLSYALQPNTRLALEMARSDGGNGWQLSAQRTGQKFSAKALYRSADSGFSSAGNPNLLRERNGYVAEMRFKTGPFALGAASQRFHDGRDGRQFVDSASLGFARRGLPSASLFWQSSEQLSLPFGSLDFDNDSSQFEETKRALALQPTKSRRLGFQIADSIAGTSVALGFDRNQSRLTDTPLSAQSSDRISLSLARPFGARTSARLFQSWNLNSAAQKNASQTGMVTQINVNHRLARGVAVGVGLQRQEIRSGPLHGNAFVADLALQLPLNKNTSVEVQYRAALRGSAALSSGADRVQIRFSRNFNVGRQRKANARTVAQRRLLGQIVGRVFDDLNNNGRFDEGEPAVANVAFSLRGAPPQRSNRLGNFRFDDVALHSSQIALVGKTLPIEFAALTAAEVPVTPAAGKTVTVDFPVVRTGKIQGVVFEDANRNGLREADEAGLAGVMVQVENSEVISFTNERGEFTLSNLPPKTCVISVDTASIATATLDGDSEMTSAPLSIQVAPNATVSNVLIGVAQPNREIVNAFEKAD